MYYIGHAIDPPPYPPQLSTTAHDFLNSIFKRNPRKRANVCQLLRHPFITGADLEDPERDSKLLSNEQKAKIVEQMSNVKGENEEEAIASIASPKSIKPAIEIDSSLDDSEYITNGQKQTFNFVSKQPGTTEKDPHDRIKKDA